MGYFPNGTAGDMYEAKWCARCVHQKPDDGGCPVLLLHLLWNYDACNGDQDEASDERKAKHTALGVFIAQKGTGNLKCTMFHEKPADGGRRRVSSAPALSVATKRVYETEAQFRERVNE